MSPLCAHPSIVERPATCAPDETIISCFPCAINAEHSAENFSINSTLTVPSLFARVLLPILITIFLASLIIVCGVIFLIPANFSISQFELIIQSKCHSPERATTGSSFAALEAGLSPKKIPTNTENTNEIMQELQLIT